MKQIKCRYCDKPATRLVKWEVGGITSKPHLESFYLCDGTPRKACNFWTGHLEETRLSYQGISTK